MTLPSYRAFVVIGSVALSVSAVVPSVVVNGIYTVSFVQYFTSLLNGV